MDDIYLRVLPCASVESGPHRLQMRPKAPERRTLATLGGFDAPMCDPTPICDPTSTDTVPWFVPVAFGAWFIGTFLLSWLMTRQRWKSPHQSGRDKSIHVSKLHAITFAYIMCLGAALFTFMLMNEPGFWLSVFVTCALILVGAQACQIVWISGPSGAIRWNDTRIDIAGDHWGMPIGPRRTLEVSRLTYLYRGGYGGVVIGDETGQKIDFDGKYRGVNHLLADLLRLRPDLFESHEGTRWFKDIAKGRSTT